MQIKIVCCFSMGGGVGQCSGGFEGQALNKDSKTEARKIIGQR